VLYCFVFSSEVMKMEKYQQKVKDYGKELLDIHDSLDELTESLMTSQVKAKTTADTFQSYVLDVLYPLRLRLGAIYHKIPYDDARACHGRIDVIDKAVSDLLERKRIEELARWSNRMRGLEAKSK